MNAQVPAQQFIAQPSVQSLLLQCRFNGTVLGSATGFLSQNAQGRHYLLTNRHVVTGRRQDDNQPMHRMGGVPNELVIWHNRTTGIGQWIAKVEPLYGADDVPLWREHPNLGAQADIVALPLTQLDEVRDYSYDLNNPGADIQVGVADPVSVVGFPFGLAGGGLFAIWATGFQATEPIADFGDRPTLLIDCRSRSGQSGSPVIAYRSGGMLPMAGGGAAAFAGPVWRLIGMYSGRINAESDLGIVWKLSALRELMAPL